MIINNNIMAYNANRYLGVNNKGQAGSMEKLASGLRINRAGDDAAGLAISETLRNQIAGLQQASRNAQDGISLIQTAEGALSEVHSMLQRVRELSIQSMNDTYSDSDREKIDLEVQELLDEINSISEKTEFNGITLLGGGDSDSFEVDTFNPYTDSLTSKADADELNAYAQAQIAAIEGIGIEATAPLTGSEITNVTAIINALDEAYENAANYEAFNTAMKLLAYDPESYYDLTIEQKVLLFDKYAGTAITAGGATSGGTSGSAVLDKLLAVTGPDIDSDDYNSGSDILAELNKQYQSLYMSDSEKWVTDYSEMSLEELEAELQVQKDELVNYIYTMTTTAVNGGTGITATGTEAKWDDIFELLSQMETGLKADSSAADDKLLALDLEADGYYEMTLLEKLAYYDEAMEQTGTNSIGVKAYEELTKVVATVPNTEIDAYDAYVYEIQALTAAINAFEEASTQTFDFHVGANENQKVSVAIDSVDTTTLGLNSVNMLTKETASSSLSKIDAAVDMITTQRAKLGAAQNRIEYTVKNVDNTTENLQSAESQIRDTDMATEMVELTKYNILTQASQSMLTQANQNPYQVLGLLT
ncbi:MAG: hypothetical protein ATN33_08550 [Epulopiscium sp. Nele67-Bin001]|nr:MAG: hypothetical protein ATN33_08550 [Epulopiscium sp. Nele67-Bin001]